MYKPRNFPPRSTNAPTPSSAQPKPAQGEQRTPYPADGYAKQQSTAYQTNGNQNAGSYQDNSNVPQQADYQPNAEYQEEANFDMGKIAKINGKDKVIDFRDALVMAYEKDYANIHGRGGKKRAVNSGIRVTICDFTAGTGDASVSVSYLLDVRQCDRLLSIVRAADTGVLGIEHQLRAVKQFATANGMTIGWLQSQHQPSFQELAGLQQTLQAGLVAQDPDGLSKEPVWSYEVQKNNPHPNACVWIKGEDGKEREYTKVSTFSMTYNPTRKYAWTIKIANYMAPINRTANGASTHSNKDAINKTEAFILVTTEALHLALTDVDHYIRLWEYRMYPTVAKMCAQTERKAAAERERKRNENQQGYRHPR